MQANPLFSAGRGWFRQRVLIFKLLGVGFFALILLIPLNMVRSTLWERHQRFHQAVESIAQSWGSHQQILGPILVVPFTHRMETEQLIERDGQTVREKKVTIGHAEAYFLPERLKVEGDLDPIERHRGIYRTHVYSAGLSLSGEFSRPDLAFADLNEVRPDWARARVCFSITDMRGTAGALEMRWGEETLALEPGTRLDSMPSGVHAVVDWSDGTPARTFALDLNLNGSAGLAVVPVGRSTEVDLNSAWPDPKFDGAYLPVYREVGPGGFAARWAVSYYGRGFGQNWASRGGETAPTAELFRQSAFGVEFFEPVNAYRTTERAIKYGILFIALVFSVFFLFEAMADVRLNALNYLLVGAALCLFYLGVLALSEFAGFGYAYAGSALASIALIGLYCRHILRERRRAWLVSGLIGGVLGYLYFVLQMEDFALLAGTVALFAMLGAVMYGTRKLNTAGNGAPDGPPPLPDTQTASS